MWIWAVSLANAPAWDRGTGKTGLLAAACAGTCVPVVMLARTTIRGTRFAEIPQWLMFQLALGNTGLLLAK
jgi:hypothetical protein